MTIFLHWRKAGPEKMVTSMAVTEDIISHQGTSQKYAVLTIKWTNSIQMMLQVHTSTWRLTLKT